MRSGCLLIDCLRFISVDSMHTHTHTHTHPSLRSAPKSKHETRTHLERDVRPAVGQEGGARDGGGRDHVVHIAAGGADPEPGQREAAHVGLHQLVLRSGGEAALIEVQDPGALDALHAGPVLHGMVPALPAHGTGVDQGARVCRGGGCWVVVVLCVC